MFDFKNKGKSLDRSEYTKMINEHPTVVSRKEYLMNKAKKRTHIANLKPERMGMIDKRLAEKDFTTENELS